MSLPVRPCVTAFEFLVKVGDPAGIEVAVQRPVGLDRRGRPGHSVISARLRNAGLLSVIRRNPQSLGWPLA
jgi:hypothetical protein